MHFRFALLPSILALLLPLALVAQPSILFTENRGQIVDTHGDARPDIHFVADAPGMRIYFRSTGVSYVFIEPDTNRRATIDRSYSRSIEERAFLYDSTVSIRGYRLDMELEEASARARIDGGDAVESFANYYLAHCPDGITHVRSYRSITYHDIYPKIDLVFRVGDKGVKYDFVVRPGGNVDDIRLRYHGADAIGLVDGEMRVSTPHGELHEGRPITYQVGMRDTSIVASSYVVDGDRVRFELGDHDRSRSCVIDPSLQWSTYYGGNSADQIGREGASAIDRSGAILATGLTMSFNFPVTVGAFQSSRAGTATAGATSLDAIVIKMRRDGTRAWATFLGGTDHEIGLGISSDADNNVVCSGGTHSTDFPVSTGAFQTSHGGGTNDCFVVKFDSTGTRIWGTYFGGSGGDGSNRVACDSSGNITIVGGTNSNGITTSGAFQTTGGTSGTSYIAQFTSGGSRSWCTYYVAAALYSIAVDPTGNIYVTGTSGSQTFSTTSGAYQTTLGGSNDGMIAKFTSGGARVWSTYFGGPSADELLSVVVGRDTNLYLCGNSHGTGFPVSSNAFQTSHSGDWDQVVVSMTSNGGYRWSTYYGASGYDRSASLALTSDGGVVVVGTSLSSGFPVTPTAYQAAKSGSADATIVKLDSLGARLWGTFLGGSQGDFAYGVGAEREEIVVTGITESFNFPTTPGAFQNTYGGSSFGGSGDIFISRFCVITPRISKRTLDICRGDSTELTAPAGYQYSWSTGATTQTISARQAGTYWVRTTDGICAGYSDTITLRVHELPAPSITPNGPTRFCLGDSVRLDAGAFNAWRWSTGDTTRSITVRQAGTYTVMVTDARGCIGGTSIQIVTDTIPVASIAGGPFVCPDDTITLSAPAGYSRYQWSTGEMTPQIRVTRPGNYSIRITNAHGCTSPSASVTITQYPKPMPAISPATPRYCPGERVTISAPEGYVAYRWSNGETTREISVADTSLYTVSIVDSNGCRATSPGVRARPYVLRPSQLFAVPRASFCLGDSIVLTGLAGFARYEWSTGAATQAIVVRTGGTYQLTVTDSNGCRQTTEIYAQSLTLPTPRLSQGGRVSICEGESLVLSVDRQFAEYHWSDSSNNGELVITKPGRYHAWVRDAGGCVGYSDTLEVVVSPKPSVDLSGASAICSGTRSRYSVTSRPGVRYQWTIVGGSIASGDGSAEIDVQWGSAGRGRVILVATDSTSGCFSNVSIDVEIGSQLSPIVRTSRPPILCLGDSVELDAGDGYASYRWSTGETTRRITVRQAGDYSVSVSDAGGCSGSSPTTSVRVNAPPVPAITSTKGFELCEGDSLTLDAGDYASYRWSSGERSRTIVVRSAGSYSVDVVDSAGCGGSSSPVVVTLKALPRPVIDGPNSVCVDAEESYTVGDSIALPVQWSVTGGTITSGQNTRRVVVKWGTSGSGVVTATTSGNDCFRSERYAVRIDSELHPKLTPSGVTTICSGESATLSAPSGYATYLWNTGETTRQIIARTGGPYWVDVTSSGGCAGTSDTVVVIESMAPTPVVTPATAALCVGDSIELDAGAGYASYKWSSGETTRRIIVRQGGSYTVDVTNAGGCIGTSSPAVITLYPSPVAPTITRDADTLLSSSAESYQWNRDGVAITGATSQRYEPSVPGVYTVTITDSNGCRATSEPLDYRSDTEARATITLATIDAIPGERIRMPITLSNGVDLDKAGAREYAMTVRFNRTLLLPTGLTPIGAIDGRQRVVTYNGVRGAAISDGEIGALEFEVALGDSYSTSVQIDTIVWTSARVRTVLIDGEVRIMPPGGWGLYIANGELTLLPLRPNPASEMVEIVYETIEPGRTMLSVKNVLGQTVETILDEQTQPGRSILRHDVRGFAAGTYFYVLETPTGRRVESVVVVR